MQVIEVCCGAGGMALGLARAGFRIARAVDVWEEALAVYRRNVLAAPSLLPRRHHTRKGDLSDLLSLIPSLLHQKCDLVAGGPPCQDFSSAGLQIEGARAGITLGFAVVVAAIRPRWFLMENVARARKSDAWVHARTVLKRAGYGLTETIVDASRYGVGQARKRFIVIGRLDEADGFLSGAIKEAESKRRTTVRDILGDDVGIHPGGDHPSTTRVFFVRPFKNGRGVRSIDEPCPAILRTTAAWAARHYPRHKNDIALPRRVPPLTPQQVSRLQGFPENWSWDSVKRVRDRDQMIANAMPAPLAEALGKLILARDRGENLPALEPGYADWLVQTKKLSGPVLRNRKTQLNRARRLLKGRILADIAAELALLEQSRGFAQLSTSTKSDLRLALRWHWEWREEVTRRLWKPEIEDDLSDPCLDPDRGDRAGSPRLAALAAKFKSGKSPI